MSRKPSDGQSDIFEELASRIDPGIFDSSIGAFDRHPLGWLRQLIENSDDAGAKSIKITLNKDTVTILDDGDGITPAGRDALASWGVSTKRRATAKGRFGTGAKVVYKVAERISYKTVSIEDKDREEREISFTADDIKASLFEGRRLSARRHKATRPGTYTEVEVVGIKRARHVTVDSLLKNLGGILEPRVSEKITVNDKKLEKRQITGRRIQLVEEHPKLGEISVDIYIPKHRTDYDRLRIGAKGPVCSFREFIDPMSDIYKRRIPEVFLNPDVCGVIDIPKFNNYSSVTRNEFDSNLYDSDEGSELLDLFLDFLTFELGSKVEVELGVSRKIEQEALWRQIIRGVQDELNEVYGYVPGTTAVPGQRPEWDIILNARRLEMIRGETYEFHILRSINTSGNFVWDADQSGGKINAKTGKKITYTAGKQCDDYVLTVADAEDEDKKIFIKISIVAEKRLRLAPSSAVVPVGGKVLVRAKNVELTSGEKYLLWIDDNSGGSIEPKRSTDSVVYTAGNDPGKYSIVCVDRSNPEKFSATCQIEVVAEKTAHRGEEPLPEIKIRDTIFILRTEDHRRSNVITYLLPGTEKHEVFFNAGHPTSRRLTSEPVALRQLILDQLFIKYAELNNPTLQPGQLSDLIGQLAAEITLKIQEAEA